MKKIFSVILIAVCCLSVTTTVEAQILRWGVKGGVNMTKVSVSHSLGLNFKDENTTGFFIGPMAEATVPLIGLGLDVSLLFSQRGVNYDEEGDKRYGLDIPVNLKYTFGLGSSFGVYLAAGPDFYFDFSKGEMVLEEKVDRKKAQVGINVGAGLKLLRHLQIGVNYNIPMGDSFTYKEVFAKGKNKTWQISAVYLF